MSHKTAKIRSALWIAVGTMAVSALAARDVDAHMAGAPSRRATGVTARAALSVVGEQVDLGLSVNWADRNVGATSPNDLGDLYGYGDLSGEEISTSYNKYVSQDISGTDRDPAYVFWGAGWRMPRTSEMNELINRCEWHWTVRNGVEGYLVVGVSDFSIFLPATGHKSSGKTFFVGKRGYYWSGEVDETNANYVNTLFFYKGNKFCKPYRKIYGFAIRPVHD